MRITKELTITIVSYLIDNPEFYFPFDIHYKDVDNELVTIQPDENDLQKIIFFDDSKEFFLTENLNHLFKETLELMSLGFIDKITKNDIHSRITLLSQKYRNLWNKDLCDSENIIIYGKNEYLGGKADAFEECLKILETRKIHE